MEDGEQETTIRSLIDDLIAMSKDAAILEVDDNFEAAKRLRSDMITFNKKVRDFSLHIKSIKQGIMKARGRKYE